MANVIGSGKGRFLTDETGDPIDGTNRLPVETEQDDAFSSWTTYDDIQVGTTAANLNSLLSLSGGNKIADAKEILIQLHDDASGYIMVGSGTTGSSDTTTGAAGSRHGIKVDPGQVLILAIADFDTIWIDGSASNQTTTIAYFK